MKKRLIFLLIFIISAFLLNFVWENLHFSLYAGNNIGINNYWLLMMYASFIDAFWITVVYLLLALINKKLNWKLNKRNMLLFVGLLIVAATLIEINALTTGRWSYGKMPVVFGIGLSPLIQLAVTGLIAVLISRKITKFSLE